MSLCPTRSATRTSAVSAGWVAKRFWSTVEVEPVAGGYGLRLDAKPLKTPGKAPFVVPGATLAAAVAAEWRAQQGVIRPQAMPFTRAANSAIDKVRVQQAEVVAIVAAYGGSDLLCYRALGPEPLVARQAAAWDPLLAWAASIGAPLRAVAGVMHIAQAEPSLACLSRRVAALDAFVLTGFHDLVAISGSLVIGLAVLDGMDDPERLWAWSRIDEAWQAEVWGADAEAEAAAALKQTDFLQAARFCRLCRE